MADYVLTCPVCEGPMFDNRAPGNKLPWKPGTPIARCKNYKTTGCKGVYWEDSKAGAKAVAKPVPQQAPVTSGSGPVPFDSPQALRSLADDCADYAQVAYTLALSLGKCIEDCFNDGDTKTAEALATMLSTSLQAATFSVFKARKDKGK